MIDLATYFLIGLIAALLGSMTGLGGGFVAVPALYYLGLPPPTAIAVSKVMVFANSGASTYRYSRAIKLPMKLYLSVITLMIPTAYLGAYLVVVIPQRLLIIVVGLVLLAGSLRIILSEGEKKVEKIGSRMSSRKAYFFGAISGSSAGVIAGLTGLGGGIVNVPAFIYLLDLDVHTAVSLSMACILPSSFSSVVRHIIDGIILWRAAIPLSAGALFGGWIGPRISLRLSRRKLRKVVGAMIAVAVLRILLQAILQV